MVLVYENEWMVLGGITTLSFLSKCECMEVLLVRMYKYGERISQQLVFHAGIAFNRSNSGGVLN